MKISATIITQNEQKNIARAIESLDFVDEIIVVDSGSSDKTCEIARELGAQVFTNKFQGFGQQKNFAAQCAGHDWILSIDADEEVTPELRNSILNELQKKDCSSIYYINRRTNYRGQWIYHGGWYPDHLARLYRKSDASWSEPFVHEELIPKKKLAKKIILKGHLNHYSFPSYLSQVEVNLKYAKLGAKALLDKKKRTPYFYELILKPVSKFIECYFLKRGILDGRAGLTIALNASYSMFMKYMFAIDQEKND